MRFSCPMPSSSAEAWACARGSPRASTPTKSSRSSHAVESGEPQVRVPVYSHATYDRSPDAVRVLGLVDVVIVEGVNALQPPIVDHLDLSVYVDADEDDMQAWFVDRFIAAVRAGASRTRHRSTGVSRACRLRSNAVSPTGRGERSTA